MKVAGSQLAMTRSVILGLVAALLVGLALRLPELGRRPMHNDEAVNALKVRSLREQGVYRYDPNEHHGPTLAYFTSAWLALTRAPAFSVIDEARLRGLTVAFGIGLILLLPLIADGLGRGALVCAGLLTAISPALVYYSRDYIHETLLVFSTFLALGAGWRYLRSRKLFWAILAGAAAGLMQSTKETFVLVIAALAMTGILNTLWTRCEAGAPKKASPISKRHLLAAIGVWIFVAVLFFSSLFTNAGGPIDAVKTYFPWLHRAQGASPHVHPWDFYLSRLLYFHTKGGRFWTEAFIAVLAAIGFVAAARRKSPRGSHQEFLRFLGLYALTLTAIYSFIPYKTPWCMLGFVHPMILLAGAGAVVVFQKPRALWAKALCGFLLLAGAGHLAAQAWLASQNDATDRGNPYVYAQTSPNILELADTVQALAQAQPDGHHVLIKVIAPANDYWPLPWYLRAFDQVGWWEKLPPNPLAPIMIVSTQFHADLEAGGNHVMAGLFQLRPGAFLELYVQTDLWRNYVNQRPKTKPPAP